MTKGLAPLLRRHSTRQQQTPNATLGQVALQRVMVLSSQHLRRSHQDGLVFVGHGDEQSIDRDGSLAGDFRMQAQQAFENLKAALAAIGATFDDVVKLNNYLVDIGTNLPALREVRDGYLNASRLPASTTVGVPGLAHPDALYEVEAVVALAR